MTDTPEQAAQAAYDLLMNNPVWVKAYLAGGEAERLELNGIQSIMAAGDLTPPASASGSAAAALDAAVMDAGFRQRLYSGDRAAQAEYDALIRALVPPGAPA